MRDNDSGSEQQSGWQPPEYVSPWTPASGSGGADSTPGSGDTISFGAEGFDTRPEYAASGQPRYAPPEDGHAAYGEPGYGHPPPRGYGAWSGGPGGQYPWGGYGPPPPPPHGSRFGRA